MGLELSIGDHRPKARLSSGLGFRVRGLGFGAVWGLGVRVYRGLSKSGISRVRIGVTPFRVVITLLITYLLSPLGL